MRLEMKNAKTQRQLMTDMHFAVSEFREFVKLATTVITPLTRASQSPQGNT